MGQCAEIEGFNNEYQGEADRDKLVRFLGEAKVLTRGWRSAFGKAFTMPYSKGHQDAEQDGLIIVYKRIDSISLYGHVESYRTPRGPSFNGHDSPPSPTLISNNSPNIQ